MFVELLARFGDHLFDAGRVDTAIGHQLFEGQAGYFAADGVEAGDDDGLRGVIHDDFGTGSRFEGADIAAFAADDLAFEVIGIQVEDGDSIFDGVFCTHALNRLDDDFLGLLIGICFGLFDRFFDDSHGVSFCFCAHGVEQLLLGLLFGQAGDAFQFLDAEFVGHIEFLFLFGHDFELFLQVFADRFEFCVFEFDFRLLGLEGALAFFDFFLFEFELIV